MNKLILNEFENFLVNDKNVSPNTIASYKRDISNFSKFLAKIKIDFISVSRNHILSYVLSMQDSGKANASVMRAIASIKSMYSFLVYKGTIAKNPAFGITPPKKEKKMPQFLSHIEIEALLESPDVSCLRGLRDKAILEIELTTPNAEISFPKNLKLIREVTGDKEFFNRSLASKTAQKIK